MVMRPVALHLVMSVTMFIGFLPCLDTELFPFCDAFVTWLKVTHKVPWETESLELDLLFSFLFQIAHTI